MLWGWILWPLVLGGIVVGVLFIRQPPNSDQQKDPPATPVTPSPDIVRFEPALTEAEARQQELLEENASHGSDPELADEYQEINQLYFANALPVIPVVWESRLAEIGPLLAKGFTLKGVTNGRVILLNADLRRDAREFRRVLCHEMVHGQFLRSGDTTTNHGPAFQDELRRLSEEGAFEGIAASGEERLTLRSWLDAESNRLGREETQLRRASAELKGEIGTELKTREEDFNVRISEFNRRTSQYNLMMAYPDGLDEESLVQEKLAR